MNIDSIEQTHLYRCRPSPQRQDSTISWYCPAWEGGWNADGNSHRCRLMDGPDGYIDWNCIQPVSQVNLRHHTLGTLTGQGYVEYLEMTIPPWRLPIQQLVWGRFIGRDTSLVWIRWESPNKPMQWIFNNGQPMYDAKVSSKGIESQQGHLTLEAIDPVRSGNLDSAVLSRLGWLRYLLPSRIKNLQETKWRCRGIWQGKSQSPVSGWAIHEVVNWP